MQKALASLVAIFLASTPALAQAAAASGETPWLWIILGAVVIGGGIWWYIKRMR